jgi:hypothetical protein
MYNGMPVYVSVRERDRDQDMNRRLQVNIGDPLAIPRAPPARPAPVPVEDGHIVNAYPLPVDFNAMAKIPNPIAVDYRDSGFSYKAFELGYINFDTATYLMRAPMRQQAQGLLSGCVIGFPRVPTHPGWFTSQSMKNCILGVYPTLAEAEDILLNYAARSVAISRTVAISRGAGDSITLHYRGRTVGHKSGKEYTLLESREKNALKSVLKDVICLT